MQLKKMIIVGEGSDALNRYFAEIRNFEALTKEQERELIIVVQNRKPGHEIALDKLVKANLKFVISVAKQYQGQGSDIMDLISEGNGGLLRAIEAFDISRDLKLFSYAVWYIRLQIFKSLYNDTRTIRLPDNRALLVSRIKKELVILEQKLQRSPSIDELIDWMEKIGKKKGEKDKFTREEIYEAIVHGGREKSIQDKVRISNNFEDDLTLEDITSGGLETDQIDRTKSLVHDLNRFFHNLTQKEYDVLALFMGLNGEDVLKTSDISRALGIKEKEVNKLRMRAVKRMKRLRNIESLKDYL